MDARKAYGVEQALGRALAATPDGVDRLRALASKADLAAWLATLELKLPAPLVAEYLDGVAEADWPKIRAKLVLAARLATGDIQAGKGHEAGGFRR